MGEPRVPEEGRAQPLEHAPEFFGSRADVFLFVHKPRNDEPEHVGYNGGEPVAHDALHEHLFEHKRGGEGRQNEERRRDRDATARQQNERQGSHRVVPLGFDVRDLGQSPVGDVSVAGVPAVYDGENQDRRGCRPQRGPLEFFAVGGDPSTEGLDAVVRDNGETGEGKSDDGKEFSHAKRSWHKSPM